MRLRWTDEEIKYFNKPIPTAEKQNEWSWWGIFIAVVIMEIIVIGKIIGII